MSIVYSHVDTAVSHLKVYMKSAASRYDIVDGNTAVMLLLPRNTERVRRCVFGARVIHPAVLGRNCPTALSKTGKDIYVCSKHTR